MDPENRDMIELVDKVRSQLNLKRFLVTIFIGIVFGALLILLIGYLTQSSLPREDHKFMLLTAIMLVPLAFLIHALKVIFTAKTSRQDIALKVEASQPELMDSYVCALEIANKGGPRGPIESTLVTNMCKRFDNGEISKLVTPRFLSRPAVGLFLFLSFFTTWLAFGSPLFKSAITHAKAQVDNSLVGVKVIPGNIRLAVGEDLQVEAVVVRGKAGAALQHNTGQGWQEITMLDQGNGHYLATIYGIEQDSLYKVVTPTVSSEEFKVSVFLKPALESFQIQVTPPEYTSRKPFTVKELKDLAVPQDSEIAIEFKANKKVKAYIIENKSALPLGKDYTQIHQYSLRATSSSIYSIRLKDQQNNEMVSQPFKINIVKDMPPHVEITEPAKDLKKNRFERVPLEVSALDDYGLTKVDLTLDYSFGSSETIQVFRPKSDQRNLEKNLIHELNLKELGLKEGDVITYYFSATDNRQPIPQTSRSKIYFIEIHPDKSEQQKEDEEKKDGEQQEELSVSDLIASQKDLIRSIIDVKSKSSKDPLNKDKYKLNPEDRQALSAASATLKLAVQKRHDELKKEAKKMGASLGVIGELFDSSVKNLKEAESQLNESSLIKGLQANSKSLSDLIKIAIELEKNSQKQKSKKPPKKPKQQKEQEEQQKDERLADMLEKLEDLEEQQEQLNKELRDMDKEELPEQKAMKEKMDEQKKSMDKLKEELQEQQQQQASQQMKKASEQMQQAQQQMQQGDSKGAQQQAQKAEENIKNAKNEIKRAMREQAREKLQQLSKKLDNTIDRQNKLGEDTSKVKDTKSPEGKKEMADLKKKQDKVQKDMQEIMDQLGAAANEVDEKYPDVAESLRKSREFAANQGIDRRLKRSSNALHYKRQAAAKREQQKAEEAMNLLGHKVKDAISKLPQATLEELLKMRQETEMVKRQLNGQRSESIGKSEANQITDNLKSMISEIGRQVKNDQLQYQLPEFLESLKSKGNGKSIIKDQMKAVNMAGMILDKMISELDLENRLSLNRQTGTAPDKYRKSVREYLKSLSTQDK